MYVRTTTLCESTLRKCQVNNVKVSWETRKPLRSLHRYNIERLNVLKAYRFEGDDKGLLYDLSVDVVGDKDRGSAYRGIHLGLGSETLGVALYEKSINMCLIHCNERTIDELIIEMPSRHRNQQNVLALVKRTMTNKYALSRILLVEPVRLGPYDTSFLRKHRRQMEIY